MNTLELTLQRKTDGGYPAIAALTRPGGFLPLRREGMLNLDLPTLAELQYDSLAYGTALGKALFVDEIRDTFREGLSGGEPLRVLLSIEAADLRALNWHRLAAPFDGRWRFLASQQNTPFSLSIPSPTSARFPALGRRDLRALILVAGPESLSGDYKLASFDVPATIAGIQESLGDIPCDVLQNPSLDALCAALTATPYTFLHLVCHGAVNQNDETILYFPKDSKRGPTPATEFLNRLSSLARLPHFAFIAACESALPQNGLGSLAGRLVRELGLPAVLAMTDCISIATAEAIAAPFYAKLYEHGQPDLALAQSLAGLQGAHDLTVPAVFSRLGDQSLFDDTAYSQKQVVENYLGLIESRNRYLVSEQLFNTQIELRQVFAMLDVCELKPNTHTGNRKETIPTPPIPFGQMIQQNRKIVLLGSAGSGKSTLLQHLTLKLAEEESNRSTANTIIPILVSLRGYSGQQRLDDFLLARFHLDYVPEEEAREWLESGRLWVMLDGLDEVSAPNRKQVVQAIEQFTYTSFGKNTRLIVTSRPAGYLEHRLVGAEFAHFELQIFNQPSEMQEYLATWLAALQGKSREHTQLAAQEFIHSIQTKQGTWQIPNTPLLLRLSANTFARNQQVLSDRSQLYREYIKLLLDQASNRQADPNHFYRARVEQGLESLAWAMQTALPRDMENLANALNKSSNGLDGQELIRYTYGEIGLLRVDFDDLRGQEIFGFVHQSFQEYLVGRTLSSRWMQDEEQTWDFLKKRLHHNAWYDPILFMSSQITISDRTRLVQRILDAKSPYERALCRDFLLAGAICLSAPVAQPLQNQIESGLQDLLRESTFRHRQGAGFDLGDQLLIFPALLGLMVALLTSWQGMPTSLASFFNFLGKFIVWAIVFCGPFIAIFSEMQDKQLRWLVSPIAFSMGKRKFSLLHKRVEQLLHGNLQVVIETEKSFQISMQTKAFLNANGIGLPSDASDEKIMDALKSLEYSEKNIGYLFKHMKNSYVEYWDDRSPDTRPIAEEAMRLLVYFSARLDLQTNQKIAKQISSYLSEGWSNTPEVAYQALDQLAARIAEMEIQD